MGNTIPLDGSIRATYSDGFVLDETEFGDVSPYDPTVNILRAVLNKDPETEHGKMTQFSVFYKDKSYDIDWSDMPDNARPIRYKKMEQDYVGGQITETRLMKLGFGYQFTDENGNKVEEIEEL